MSRGKYSPFLPRNSSPEDFGFNCYKQRPAEWSKEVQEAGVVYDDKTMFADYDSEGYDRYGYSAFDADGQFVGHGSGVDRRGYTELDYLRMSDDEFENL